MGAIRFKGETYACAEEPENDISDKEVTFETEDELEPEEPSEAPLVQSGPIKTLFKTLSTIGKNTRYLLKMMGTTDISQLGDGTVTGAIETLGNRNVKLTGDVIGTGVLDENGDIGIKVERKQVDIARDGRPEVYAIIGEAYISSAYESVSTSFKISGVSSRSDFFGFINFYASSNNNNTALNIYHFSWEMATENVKNTDFFVIWKKYGNRLQFKFVMDISKTNYTAFYIIPYLSHNAYGSGVTIYDIPEYVATIEDDYTQITSTLATIQNPVLLADRLTDYKTAIPEATTSAPGLMSVADKIRLGGYFKTKYLDGPNIITIQTKFNNFGSQVGNRQSILLFGNANSYTILSSIVFNGSTSLLEVKNYSNYAITVEKILNNGQIKITLPNNNVYDFFIAISPEAFYFV